jgi:hypothetical protein
MNGSTSYESARSYDSDDSTVETELSSYIDKKTQEKPTQVAVCTTCGSLNVFLPAPKVSEDIFPPHSQS